MDFEAQFAEWLTDNVSQGIPDSVKAFSFNLHEPAMIDGVIFGIELVGIGAFDEEDPDWARDEGWEPDPEGLNFPTSYSGEKWEAYLERMKTPVAETLSLPELGRLKKTQGIGVG